MWDPYAEFESTVLSNGLTVHAAHWPGRPWESIGFLIHSGAEHDPVGLEGLAHFVEHLVGNNAPIPQEDLSTFFDDCGGNVDLGATGYPNTEYTCFVPIDDAILGKAFSLLGETLLSSRLEQCVEAQRTVILAEFHREYPRALPFELDRHKAKMLYDGSWLERFVAPLGSPDSIKRITQEDLQLSYDRHYTPKNMSIVAVGGLTVSALVQLLSESPFAMHKDGARTPFPVPVSNVAPPSQTRHVINVSEHMTTSSPLEVGGYESVGKLPGTIHRSTVTIVRRLLQQALFQEVRGCRSWAYDISCHTCNFRHLYQFAIVCYGLELQALPTIEQVVDGVIASVGEREDLFDQMKRQMIASVFMVDTTAAGVRDSAMNELIGHQRIRSLAEDLRSFEQVSMTDVRNVLDWLRPDRRWTQITQP